MYTYFFIGKFSPVTTQNLNIHHKNNDEKTNICWHTRNYSYIDFLSTKTPKLNQVWL